MGKTNKTHKQQTFATQIGQSATVGRETVTGEDAKTANRKLSEIGESLNPNPNLEYVGSAGIHIYRSRLLGQVYFVNQTSPLMDCPEALAQTATKDFIGSIMEFFNRKRPKLRSGF